MTKIIRPLLFSAALTLFFNICALAQTKSPLKINAIHAQLFYDLKGTFSPDVLAAKNFAFWNTIIGEGDASSPSTSTLVTVEIGGADKNGNLPKVELTATNDKGKVLLKKTLDIDLVGRTKFYAPFWLYNTGCEKIKLSARLFVKNVAAGAPVVKTIPFACGE